MIKRLAALALTAALLLGAPAATHASTVPLPVLTGNVAVMIAGDSTAGGMGIVCPDGSSFGDRKAFGDWLALNPGFQFTLVGSQSATCNQPYQRHEGHGGFTIGNLADNIGGYLVNNPAQILILRVGVNDAKASGGYRSWQQMITDYQRLINNARTVIPTIRIVASEIMGPNASVGGQEFAKASITGKEFNTALPALIGQYGDSVRIAHLGWCTGNCLGDGLHPNGVGYLFAAAADIDAMWLGWCSERPYAVTDAGAMYFNVFAH